MVGKASETTAIILARGGSKGIPRKNLVDFLGQPLLAWTLEQVSASGIERTYVSTDDQEIAEVARNRGARVISRPPHLAGDEAIADMSLLHAIEQLELDDSVPVLVPQVTSPLRLPSHIREILELLMANTFDSVFSANRIDDICVWRHGNHLESISYDFTRRANRQSREPTYVENGSLYCSRSGAIQRSQNRLSGRIGVYPMPRWTLPEIDDLEDLRLCELLMAQYALPGEQTSLTQAR